MAELTTVDRDVPIDEVLTHLHRDGGVIVRDPVSYTHLRAHET